VAVWRPGDGGEERQWLELVARVREDVKGLRREGKRCGEVLWWCSPFIRAGGAPGRGGRGVTVALNVFSAIEDDEVKGRVKEGVLMAGQVKAQGSHSRRGAGRCGVARRGGIWRWRSWGQPDRGQSPLDRER
jgi:hypothetical protein